MPARTPEEMANVGGSWGDNNWTPAPEITPQIPPTGTPPTRHEWDSFQGELLLTTVTCDVAAAASYLEEIRGNPRQRCVIIGLDTEWKKLDGGAFTTAFLQLCVGIHVLVFQVLYANGGDLPAVLKRFLIEEDHIFTGAHIENDVKQLRDDFGIIISNPIDLQLVVPKAAPRYEYLSGPHPIFKVRCSSLEKITKAVLCLPHLRKSEIADQDNWHAWYLLPSQVNYTATDAYLSYEITKQLEIKDGYRF
ncbi:hypothetical protein C2845_PM11G20040 [Panicum miliaceum]|uniref:3'-5' exonuclease domain-containing protein n=1 Tax=Panicum miliaceum TaxID=4540 RepID=A0A3L6RVQ5_PANMI|nr:hypothetical protein C2845_PM11G20040 [Panicum miliaceum]